MTVGISASVKIYGPAVSVSRIGACLGMCFFGYPNFDAMTHRDGWLTRVLMFRAVWARQSFYIHQLTLLEANTIAENV